uniref:DUF4149 domain-containing protein n=1 Tax=Syphacia muris TaxID=451379 RepID=A0A0N5ATI3_9BILA
MRHHPIPATFIIGPQLTNPKSHRRCGVHVQTLLLIHHPITAIISVLGITIGALLLIFPKFHQKSPIFRQVFQLTKPWMLIPQLCILTTLCGLEAFAILSIITLNIIGSKLIWVSTIIAIIFAVCSASNLYALVLVRNFVCERKEAVDKIMANEKTVTFKEHLPRKRHII